MHHNMIFLKLLLFDMIFCVGEDLLDVAIGLLVNRIVNLSVSRTDCLVFEVNFTGLDRASALISWVWRR